LRICANSRCPLILINAVEVAVLVVPLSSFPLLPLPPSLRTKCRLRLQSMLLLSPRPVQQRLQKLRMLSCRNVHGPVHLWTPL
jgi:hypothetical protein